MSIAYNDSEKLWVERYRPTKIEDCILKEKTRKEFTNILETGHIPNMLLSGPPGSGKTTTAKALCKELDMDWMIVNASNERGLDVIREKIMSFASTVSLGGNGKCFILDEADHLMPATQAALRNASEELSSNCSFIMTANYPNRIIEALHSRFVTIDFGADKNELEVMQAQFYGRVCSILEQEGVEYDDAVLIQVIQKYFPDNRKILNKLQQYARGGNSIDTGILMSMEEVSIDTLIAAIHNKKFKAITQWAANNSDNDTSVLYEKIYKELKNFVEPSSIPDAIMILEEGQRWDSSVPSKELHLAAVAVELMTSLEFK